MHAGLSTRDHNYLAFRFSFFLLSFRADFSEIGFSTCFREIIEGCLDYSFSTNKIYAVFTCTSC